MASVLGSSPSLCSIFFFSCKRLIGVREGFELKGVERTLPRLLKPSSVPSKIIAKHMKVERRKWKSRGLICGFDQAPKILKVRIVLLDENGDVVDLDKDNELLSLISIL
nr:hypothetical protein CFP56_79749 [Quercus suber]